jgi:hypothetical protein
VANYRALYPGGFYSSTPLDKSTGPVSIRMNNPGAINGAKWERDIPGFAGETITSYSTVGGRQVPNSSTYFYTPEAGIAAWLVLMHKYRAQGATTVRQIITKYGGGQDYSTYYKVVSERTGFGQDKVIPLDNDAVLLPFAKAMFHYEAGRAIPWSDEQILFGLQLGRAYLETGQFPPSPAPSVAPSRPPAPAAAVPPPAPPQRPRTWWELLFGRSTGGIAPAIQTTRPRLRDGMPTAEAQALQQFYIEAGVLDPLADGKVGPLTRWAAGIERLPAPLNLSTGDLAAKIAAVMRDNNWWMCRVPDVPNMLYVEGMGLDGKYNGNKPNAFNDVRCDLRFRADGTPWLKSMYLGTTEPGRYWTERRMNPGGAFRIAFGQKKAWINGSYNGMLAWRQAGVISGFRDDNEDFNRSGDVMVTGDSYGVHHHGGYDLRVDDLGRSSAGCQVVRSMSEHDRSMRDMRQDPRYIAAGANYRCISTVFPFAAFDSTDTSWKQFIA